MQLRRDGQIGGSAEEMVSILFVLSRCTGAGRWFNTAGILRNAEGLASAFTVAGSDDRRMDMNETVFLDV